MSADHGLMALPHDQPAGIQGKRGLLTRLLRTDADHQLPQDVNGHSSHFALDGIAVQVVLIKIAPL